MAETVSQTTQGAILLTEDMYTKKGVDELIAQTVKGGVTPKGSVAFASLPTPGASNVGWMYNVTDAFTTTSAFVEGEGKKYPAGTNIYVVNPSTNTYKWDALPGEGLQLSNDTPQANGTAAPGSATTAARADHVHETDTSRAPTSHASSATTYGAGTGTNYGHVKLSDATDGTAAAASGGTAATPKAVSDALAAAKQYADGKDTTSRVAAIEAAAATLYTALNGLDSASMTSANAIKTLVSSLLSYVKAFAAAADNDSSTTYTAS